MTSKRVSFFSAIIITFCAVLLIGCAGTRQAADGSKAATVMQADKARIYVYRDSSPKAGVTMGVWVDGRPVGRTAPTTHIYIEVGIGRHTIVSKASNVDTLILDAEPGKTYFVFQEAAMGTYWATGRLQVVDEHVGRAEILQSLPTTLLIDTTVDGHEGK